MRNYSKKGFTLIEIMIVIVIIGVLAAVALPSLTKQINRSRAAEAYSTLGTLMSKVMECYTLNSEQATSCINGGVGAETQFSFPASNNFTYAHACTTSTDCGGTATAKVGNGVITVQMNLGTGVVTKTATGDFAGTNK